MRAIIIQKSFMPDPTGLIADIIVYASGQRGKELANPKTKVKPTIDVKYCNKVENNKPVMVQISSMDIDFTNKIFYLSDDRLDGLDDYSRKNTLKQIAAINHARNFKEVWDLITSNIDTE